MWFFGKPLIQGTTRYLKQTPSHGKNPPDHLHGLAGFSQEGQPAEGKSRQHCYTNPHQQEKPTWKDNQESK